MRRDRVSLGQRVRQRELPCRADARRRLAVEKGERVQDGVVGRDRGQRRIAGGPGRRAVAGEPGLRARPQRIALRAGEVPAAPARRLARHDERPEHGPGADGTALHMQNFLAACRSRNYKELHDEIGNAYLSAGLCHLANISYRIGRKLTLTAGPKFANDPEADKLLTRVYRKPYVVA